MVYIKSIYLPTYNHEDRFISDSPKAKMVGVYNSFYPFGVFDNETCTPFISCVPITMLYGGNGSGKSTLLNIIAEKLMLTRKSPYSKTDFFDDYCDLCSISGEVPNGSMIITSDDIFRRLSDIHVINGSIDERRDSVSERFASLQLKLDNAEHFGKLHGLDDLERFKEVNEVRFKSASQYIRKRTAQNLKSRSNGETSMEYITEQIRENALYLLDEPENSLSPAFQLEFKTFLEESARFFNCQFIIATHSPLLLACEGAKIYNLNSRPITTCRWEELDSVKIYAKFFRERNMSDVCF